MRDVAEQPTLKGIFHPLIAGYWPIVHRSENVQTGTIRRYP